MHKTTSSRFLELRSRTLDSHRSSRLTLDSLMRSSKARIPLMVLMEPALVHICKFKPRVNYPNLFLNESLCFKENPMGQNALNHIEKMCDYAKKVQDNNVVIDGVGRLLEGVNSLDNIDKEKTAGIVARGLINLVDSVDANQKE